MVFASMILCVVSVYADTQKSGEALVKDCMELSDRLDYAQLRRVASSLITAGEREHNNRILGYGYAYLGCAQTMLQMMIKEPTSAVENLNKAIEIGNKINNDTILSSAYNSLGIYEATITKNTSLAQRYFFKSLKSAHDGKYTRIEQSININLANLAIQLNDTSGLKYAQACYDYGIRTKSPQFEFRGALNLAELYKMKGDFTTAENYASIARNLAEKNGQSDIGQINLISSVIALENGDTHMAAQYALYAIEALKEEKPRSLPEAYLMLAKVYKTEGRYLDSLEQLKMGEEAAKRYSSFNSLSDIYELMANDYEAIGNSEEALKYLHLAKDSNTTQIMAKSKKAEQEHSLILALEENENKMKMQNLRVDSQHRLIMSLSAGILLLIALLIIIMVNQRKKKTLYENLVAQNQKVVALRDELLNIPETSQCVTSSDADVCGKLSKEQDLEESAGAKHSLNDEKAEELYVALCKLMKEERLYSDPRITRETVIERLGTNRTYLTQIISKHGWMNYSHFVNSFRVDEAIRILSDKTREEIKMRDLYAELGFGSQATFYKAFSSVTGMSPVVFRKSVK